MVKATVKRWALRACLCVSDIAIMLFQTGTRAAHLWKIQAGFLFSQAKKNNKKKVFKSFA